MKLTNYKSALIIRVILIIIFLSSISPVSAQTWEEDIVQKLSLHQTLHHNEKVFVQTDRPIYLPGETIWLNAFVINAASQELNQTEVVLHVELLKPDKSIFLKEMFKIEKGLAAGQLELKENTKPGKYYLVAFTNWMRNAGSEYYYSKEIIVSTESDSSRLTGIRASSEQNNTLANDIGEVSELKQQLQVSFYPEGGDLVNGISSKVAFEVSDALGMPQSFNGMVVDDDGQIVTAAKTMWRGKGVFNITPLPGKQYFIKEVEQSDTLQRYSLPNALSEGLAMNVVDQGKEYPLAITISKSGLIADTTLFLLAVQNGKAKDALILNMSGREILTTEMDKTKFSSGIVQLTLFDQNQMARAERLVFIKKEDALNIAIKEDKLPEGSRDSVLLTMLVTSQDGDPVEGNFSIAVTDAIRVPEIAYGSANINQYLSLYSDLPGLKLNDPVLFEDSGEGKSKSELLMLTNGWRRYKWEEVLVDKLEQPYYNVEGGIEVKGKVRSLWGKNKVLKGVDVTMIADTITHEYNQKTDDKGEFSIKVNDFFETRTAVIQTKNKKDKTQNYKLDIKSSYHAQPIDQFNYFDQAYALDKEWDSKAISEVAILKEIVRKELTRAVIEDTFVITTDHSIKEVDITSNFEKAPKVRMNENYGAPDYSIGDNKIEDLMDEYPWYDGLFALLYDAFPNLRINYIPGVRLGFQCVGKSRHRVFVFVDGRLIGYSSKLNFATISGTCTFNDLVSMDPKEVRSVELIFPNNSNTRSLTFPGIQFEPSTIAEFTLNPLPIAILSIYTKTGGGVYSKSDYKGFTTITLHGYQRTKEFYHFNYSTEFNDSVLIDERNTLAWFPNLKTDENGVADFKFYTSDVSNKIRLEINGISNVGKVGSLVYQIEDSLFNSNKTRPFKNEQNFYSAKGTLEPYVSISYPDKNWSTFASADGLIEIDKKIINGSSKLLIEKAGFKSAVISYDELKEKGLKLEKAEVSNSDLSGLDIIKKVYRNQFKNRNSQKMYTKGAYREKLYDGESMHKLEDYAFVQLWPNMGERRMYIDTDIYGRREYNSMEVDKTIKFSSMKSRGEVPDFDPMFRQLSFLDMSFNKEYNYSMVGETEFQGRKMFHIHFDQRSDVTYAYYSGELFVDAETYGLAWASWHISDKGQKFIMPDLYILSDNASSFEVIDEHREMTWRYNGEIWEPDFAIYNVSFDLNGEKKRIEQEITWKTIGKDEYSQLKSSIPEEWRKKATLQKYNEYNPAQWRDSWMLPTDRNIIEQIKYLNEMISYE